MPTENVSFGITHVTEKVTWPTGIAIGGVLTAPASLCISIGCGAPTGARSTAPARLKVADLLAGIVMAAGIVVNRTVYSVRLYKNLISDFVQLSALTSASKCGAQFQFPVGENYGRRLVDGPRKFVRTVSTGKRGWRCAGHNLISIGLNTRPPCHWARSTIIVARAKSSSSRGPSGDTPSTAVPSARTVC